MTESEKQMPFRVAIIGAGMGGATAAYYLRQLFGPEVGITIFEKTGRIGGRMKSANFAGQLIETGASIYHTSNRYMASFAKTFGLEVVDKSASDDRLMIYNGRGGLSFSSLGGPSFIVPLRLLWRYGLQLPQLKFYTKSLINDFSRIYKLQDSGECFTTTASLMTAMRPEFVEMTKWTYGDWLSKQNKISEPLKSEIAYGLVSNNYCQSLNVHAFVGFITLAGMIPKLAAIRNGNELVPKKLVEHALENNPPGNPRELLHAEVTAIEQSTPSESSYVIEYLPANEQNTKKATFDYIVLAAPMHQAAKIHGKGNIHLPTKNYRRVDHTFIHGKLRASAFGLSIGSLKPSELPFILPSEDAYETAKCPFRSLLMLPGSTHSTSQIYACFSEPERTDDPVSSLTAFVDKVNPADVKEKCALKAEWLAYPIYKPLTDPQTELGNFVLAPNLYYANAIEGMASCMEIAAIGGRNVALLIAAKRRSLNQIK